MAGEHKYYPSLIIVERDRLYGGQFRAGSPQRVLIGRQHYERDERLALVTDAWRVERSLVSVVLPRSLLRFQLDARHRKASMRVKGDNACSFIRPYPAWRWTVQPASGRVGPMLDRSGAVASRARCDRLTALAPVVGYDERQKTPITQGTTILRRTPNGSDVLDLQGGCRFSPDAAAEIGVLDQRHPVGGDDLLQLGKPTVTRQLVG